MRKSLASAAIVGALLFSVSCGDSRGNKSTLTAPQISRTVITGGGSGAPVPGTCTTNNAIEAEINAVVPPGSNRGSVHGDFGKMGADINKKDIAGAQALAYSITKLLIQLYKAHSLTGTQAQAAKLINDLFCYSGLAITVTDPANASVIYPTDAGQVVVSSTGTVGSSLPSGAVTEPTVLQFVPIPDTFGGNGEGPLNTKLDQYGGFVAITSSSTTGAGLAKPVIVGVCPPPGMDATVRARLRLGHQASTGFAITPPANASFLTCPTSLGEVRSKMPKWIQALASIVLPKVAYAKMQFFATGGVGGTAGEFSPFDPVDPVLGFSGGGVGGTAGEFTKIPKAPAPLPPAGPVKPTTSSQAALQLLTPGPRVNTVVGGICTDRAAVWGGALEPECSPVVVLTTHLGTKLANVPVTWAIGIGGGTVAVAAPSPWSCGTYGGVANATTDANGESHVCWTMGGTPGTHNNSVIATPSAGGDAPAGVTFVPVSGTFTASALRRTPTSTATGLNIAFDNVAHPGSGTCSDGLTPVLTYSGDGTVPKNAGTYTLTVTCGDGSVFYNTVASTAAIVITQVVPTVSVTCPATVIYNANAQTPCSATVTGAGGLSLTPTPTYTGNTEVGTATAAVTYAGSINYVAKSGTATFQITLSPSITTVTCTATVVFTNVAQTPCTATVTGVGGLSLAPTPTYSLNTAVGIATASVNFAGDADHAPSSNSATFHITPAATTTTVSCPLAPMPFTGVAQTPCTAAVSGPGLSQSLIPTYSANTNAGTATANATFPLGGNYLASNGSANFTISPVATSTVVSCPLSATYAGSALTPCSVSVTGVGLSLTPTATYTNNAAVGTATASYNFAAGGNYLGSSNSANFTIIGFNFSDSFETASGWTATGLWNRSTLMNGASPIVNSLFPTYVNLAPGDNSNGALPTPFAGSYAFWYGDPATGSYIGTQYPGDSPHSGGISTAANSGTLTSPSITLPSVSGGSLILRFNSWFDIESVNPSRFDIMKISIQDVATGVITKLGVLNPSSDPEGPAAATPLTSGGYNSPPVWVEVVQDLSAYSGSTVRLIYSFDTRDVLYNGFRGWVIDNVRVAAEGTSASATRLTRPRIIGGPSQTTLPIVTLQPVPAPKIRPVPQP